MKIALGSTSNNKKNILSEALKSEDISDLRCHDVSSEIAEQPLTEAETIQGAKNRAKNSFLADDSVDLAFGMEGGLSKIDNIYHLVCITAIYTKNNSYYLGISSKLPLPKTVSEKIDSGEAFGIVIRQHQDQLSKESPEYLLAEKLIDRKELFTQSTQNAFLAYRAKA